jgi:hypothetical protein
VWLLFCKMLATFNNFLFELYYTSSIYAFPPSLLLLFPICRKCAQVCKFVAL